MSNADTRFELFAGTIPGGTARRGVAGIGRLLPRGWFEVSPATRDAVPTGWAYFLPGRFAIGNADGAPAEVRPVLGGPVRSGGLVSFDAC